MKGAIKKIILGIAVVSIVLPLVYFTRPDISEATVETFAVSGASTWQAPAGVFSVQVECWGGGGAGAGDSTNKDSLTTGYGGGGGAYARKTISVTPGATYNYTVGAAGTGGTGNGGGGGDTTFTGDASVKCLADGGYGGTTSAVGAGGTVANSDGTTRYAGGQGYTRSGTSGGGGGSSAGTGSNGTDATGINGASAVTGGGPGGNAGTNGVAGSAPASGPGGGGGGAGNRTGGSVSGGDGAPGQIKLTYTAATAPGAPTSLSAAAGAGKIDLAWTAPASDGGMAITGYKIYRDASSPASTLLDTVVAVTSYSDASASPGVQYYYRVKAVNAMGDSDFSNEANATSLNSIDLSGTVYQSEGGSNIGAGKTVTVYKNGAALLGSDATDANGVWALTGLNISSGDIVNAYIDGDAVYKGNTVFVSDGNGKADIHIYGGILAIRHDSGSNITNTHLSTGRVSADTTDMAYNVSGSNLIATSSVEVHVWTGDSYAPGGTVKTQNGSGNLHLDDGSSAALSAADNSISKDVMIDTGAALTISSDLKLGGNLTNNGTFSHSAGSIDFINAALTSTISSVSDISFVTLKSSAAGKIIRFQKAIAGSPKFSISGSFNFHGVLGNPIIISSDESGSQFNINFNSNQNNIGYIRVTDAGCAASSASTAIDITIYDGGNNGSCWKLLENNAPAPVGENVNPGGALKTGGSKRAPAPTPDTVVDGGGDTQIGGSAAPPTTVVP